MLTLTRHEIHHAHKYPNLYSHTYLHDNTTLNFSVSASDVFSVSASDVFSVSASDVFSVSASDVTGIVAFMGLGLRFLLVGCQHGDYSDRHAQ